MSFLRRLFGQAEPPPDPDAVRSNPVERWQQVLQQGRDDMAGLRYPEATERLTDLVIDVGRLQGSAVEAYLPVVLGTLGECWFQASQADRALEPTRQALQRVRTSGDEEGIFAYLGNLYEMHRYLGQSDEAAACIEQLAALHEQKGHAAEARRYRKQALLVRTGEPLNRVVVDLAGQRYEVAEVPGGLSGSVKFLFERNRLTLRPAEALTSQGEREAGQGHYQQALALFLDAAKADPFAPHPLYQAALAYLYLDRPADAVDAYERTEELAPGWFQCRCEGWLARQVVSGRYDLELAKGVRVLEDGPLTPQVKLKVIEQALARFPDLAPLHLLHGRTHLALGRAAEAEASFRRGLGCAEEPDIQTRLLVELAALLPATEERNQLCRQALALDGNLVAAATATILLAQ